MSKKMKTSQRPNVLVLGGGGANWVVRDAGAEVTSMGYTDGRAPQAAADERIHALVLTGGGDIDPALYGAPRHVRTQSPNNARDVVETKTLVAAFERNIPVLGICRGSQMINAAFGGTLHQHIPDLPAAHRYHNGHDHRVLVEKDTRLRRAFQKEDPWVVSLHHQAVDKVAPGFKVSARAKDGVVEAIEIADPDRWVVGVQFHPEIGTTPVMQRLVNAFVREAATKAGLPPVKPATVRKIAAESGGWFRPQPTAKPAVKSTVLTLGPSGRLVSWQCFRCGIAFDDRLDHIDHMWFIHDVDLMEHMTDAQINGLLDA